MKKESKMEQITNSPLNMTINHKMGRGGDKTYNRRKNKDKKWSGNDGGGKRKSSRRNPILESLASHWLLKVESDIATEVFAFKT